MNAHIVTARLTLRPLVDSDALQILDLFSRPEVARWSNNGAVLTTLEQAQQRVERYAGRAGGRPGHGVFAVVPRDRPAGGLIGVALLVPLPSSRGVGRDDVEIGWHLHPDQWGRGIGTEAGAAMKQRAWEIGLDEVYAVTRPDNARSQAVCRRLGMADLGLSEQWYDTTLRVFRTTRGVEVPDAE